MEMNNNNNKLRRQRRKNKGFDNIVTKQQVKSMISSASGSVTKKYLNTSLFSSTPGGTGVIVTATFPAQGILNGQREGDSLHIDDIELRVVVSNQQAAVGASDVDVVRMICVQARASNTITVNSAVAPTTGVLDLGSSGAIDLTSFINYNAKNELFHVLHDESLPVNFLSLSAAKNFQFRLKPKVAKINFTPTTTTAQSGQIYWIFQSFSSSLELGIEQRLVYHDL
jgi:hypothetical protein